MKLYYILIFICTLLVSSSFAAKNGEAMYRKCKGCHGTDGRHAPFEKQRGVLAGRGEIELFVVLRAMRYGYYMGKPDKIMEKLIFNFTEEDLKLISAYISKFKK